MDRRRSRGGVGAALANTVRRAVIPADENANDASDRDRDRDDPSARKRLEFTPAVRASDRARSRAKPRLEEPGALLGATPFFTPTSGYTPTKSTAREIESLVKNLRF